MSPSAYPLDGSAISIPETTPIAALTAVHAPLMPFKFALLTCFKASDVLLIWLSHSQESVNCDDSHTTWQFKLAPHPLYMKELPSYS